MNLEFGVLVVVFYLLYACALYADQILRLHFELFIGATRRYESPCMEAFFGENRMLEVNFVNMNAFKKYIINA